MRYYNGGCRKSFIILLSDGEPKHGSAAVLRPTGNGKCPYRQPYEVASALAHPADPSQTVQTFAVGIWACVLVGRGTAPR